MPGDKAPPLGGLWAPFWAFCYVITDLRIYPPPSPSHAPTRSRAPANQVTAGTTQGVIPMVFEHSGGRDFDLPRHSHYSGVIPMVFEHSGGRDFDLPRHSHYSGVIPMVFEHSDGARQPRFGFTVYAPERRNTHINMLSATVNGTP